jgi:hypothetical protein
MSLHHVGSVNIDVSFSLQSAEPELPDVVNIWYRGIRENLTEGNSLPPLWCYDTNSFCFGSFFSPCPSFIQSYENDESSSRQKVEMKCYSKNNCLVKLLSRFFLILFACVHAWPFHPRHAHRSPLYLTLIFLILAHVNDV